MFLYAESERKSKLHNVTFDASEFNMKWHDEERLRPVKQYIDPRFGDIIVVKGGNNEFFLIKEKVVGSKGEATEEISALKMRLEMNDMNLMKLAGFSTQTIRNLCSTSYIIKAYYEFPRTDVNKEISDLRRSGVSFADSELVHMAYQILSGLNCLHQMGLAHGDIRPELISYDRQRLHFELMDRLGDSTTLEKCQMNNIVKQKSMFISSQLYRKIKSGDKKIVYDPQKNDVFALGLVLLYAGLGTSVQSIYLKDGSIEKRQIHECIMNFDIRYSDANPLICALVKAMLQLEEEGRRDVRTILKELPSYGKYSRLETKARNLEILEITTVSTTHVPEPRKKTSPVKAIVVIGDAIKKNFPVGSNQEFDGTGKFMITSNLKKVRTRSPIIKTPRIAPILAPIINKNTKTIRLENHVPLNYSTDTFSIPAIDILSTKNTHNSPIMGGGSPSDLLKTVFKQQFDDGARRQMLEIDDILIKVDNTEDDHTKPSRQVRFFKKRYVMRKDGTVVELDPENDVTTDDIKRFLSKEQEFKQIANYSNLKEAIKNEQHHY